MFDRDSGFGSHVSSNTSELEMIEIDGRRIPVIRPEQTFVQPTFDSEYSVLSNDFLHYCVFLVFKIKHYLFNSFSVVFQSF